MKNNKYSLILVLSGILSVCLCAAMLARALAPWVILPEISIPGIAAISLAALVLDHYITKGSKHCYGCVLLFSALAFGVLPWAAGFVTIRGLLILGLCGAVVFTLCTWLFDAMTDRISTGPAAKAAPLISGIGLYLAVQCLTGMIL